MNSPVGTPAPRPLRMPASRVRSSSEPGRPWTGSVLSGPDQGGDADHRGHEDPDGEEITSHRAHAPLLAVAVARSRGLAAQLQPGGGAVVPPPAGPAGGRARGLVRLGLGR